MLGHPHQTHGLIDTAAAWQAVPGAALLQHLTLVSPACKGMHQIHIYIEVVQEAYVLHETCVQCIRVHGAVLNPKCCADVEVAAVELTNSSLNNQHNPAGAPSSPTVASGSCTGSAAAASALMRGHTMPQGTLVSTTWNHHLVSSWGVDCSLMARYERSVMLPTK